MLIMRIDVSRGLAAATLATFALAGSAGRAQSPPGQAVSAAAPAQATPPPPQFTDEVSVSWILVPVLVKSRKGYVEGLDREDFELRVDGRAIRFDDFEQRGEAAWSLVFLQDLSGSMGTGGRLEASQEAIRYFLDRSRPGDEYALASFAMGSTVVDVQFTEDQAPLRDAVSRWEAWGKTALHDAVAWLPDISGDSRNVKRAAVVVTDGADNASQMTAADARELVRRSELPVYVLGLESGDPFELDPEGHKVYRYADVLNLLAAMTGGRYFAIHGPDDLKEACATIADDLRYQYVLGFDTSGTGKSDWRAISVVVKKPGVRVVARKGYRGTVPGK